MEGRGVAALEQLRGTVVTSLMVQQRSRVESSGPMSYQPSILDRPPGRRATESPSDIPPWQRPVPRPRLLRLRKPIGVTTVQARQPHDRNVHQPCAGTHT